MADFEMNNEMMADQPETTNDFETTESTDEVTAPGGCGVFTKIAVGAISAALGAGAVWVVKKLRKPKEKYIEYDRTANSDGVINSPVIGRRPGKK